MATKEEHIPLIIGAETRDLVLAIVSKTKPVGSLIGVMTSSCRSIDDLQRFIDAFPEECVQIQAILLNSPDVLCSILEKIIKVQSDYFKAWNELGGWWLKNKEAILGIVLRNEKALFRRLYLENMVEYSPNCFRSEMHSDKYISLYQAFPSLQDELIEFLIGDVEFAMQLFTTKDQFFELCDDCFKEKSDILLDKMLVLYDQDKPESHAFALAHLVDTPEILEEFKEKFPHKTEAIDQYAREEFFLFIKLLYALVERKELIYDFISSYPQHFEQLKTKFLKDPAEKWHSSDNSLLLGWLPMHTDCVRAFLALMPDQRVEVWARVIEKVAFKIRTNYQLFLSESSEIFYLLSDNDFDELKKEYSAQYRKMLDNIFFEQDFLKNMFLQQSNLAGLIMLMRQDYSGLDFYLNGIIKAVFSTEVFEKFIKNDSDLKSLISSLPSKLSSPIRERILEEGTIFLKKDSGEQEDHVLLISLLKRLGFSDFVACLSDLGFSVEETRKFLEVILSERPSILMGTITKKEDVNAAYENLVLQSDYQGKENFLKVWLFLLPENIQNDSNLLRSFINDPEVIKSIWSSASTYDYLKLFLYKETEMEEQEKNAKELARKLALPEGFVVGKFSDVARYANAIFIPILVDQMLKHRKNADDVVDDPRFIEVLFKIIEEEQSKAHLSTVVGISARQEEERNAAPSQAPVDDTIILREIQAVYLRAVDENVEESTPLPSAEQQGFLYSPVKPCGYLSYKEQGKPRQTFSSESPTVYTFFHSARPPLSDMERISRVTTNIRVGDKVMGGVATGRENTPSFP